MAPLRCGILSTARINSSLLTAAASVEDVAFTAVASRVAERARAYADRVGIERAYGSYAELLADPDLDLVYISLPNHLHAEWTLRALEAGKHVLCEKPLTRSVAEAERIVAVAADTGFNVYEAFMYQHLPLVAELRRLVATGAIGTLRAVHCTFSFTLPAPEHDHRASAAHQGGALADIGCYCVHLIRSLAGEPDLAFAEAVMGWDEVDVRCCAILRCGDVLASFDTALDEPTRSGVEVVGAEGVIRVGDPWHARRAEIEIVRELDADVIPVRVADPYRVELEHVAASIRSGEPHAEGIVAQARALEALYASMAASAPTRIR